MKRSLLALIAAIVLATTHAFAADLWAPPPMPYKAPPPVASGLGLDRFLSRC